jgi:hypothetical protein
MLKMETMTISQFIAEVKGRLGEGDAEIERLRVHLMAIQGLVNEQAEDEALWSVPAEGTQSISEAYLQQELRRLHGLIEGEVIEKWSPNDP